MISFRATRCPSPSPFPLKLETFLRAHKIPYINDYSEYPSAKGKIPWITIDGQEVADSQACIDFLSNRYVC